MFISNIIKDNIITNVDKNIVRIVVDKKVSTDLIENTLKRVTLLNPSFTSIEYLIDNKVSSNVDTTNIDLSGVNIETVIKDFIDLLEIDNKDIVFTQCLEIYSNCR